MSINRISTSAESAALAEILLDAMGLELGLTIDVIGDNRANVGETWRIEAVDVNGDLWVTLHEDYYTAAKLLAELMGFESQEA